jgi:hypothetical protein
MTIIVSRFDYQDDFNLTAPTIILNIKIESNLQMNNDVILTVTNK